MTGQNRDASPVDQAETIRRRLLETATELRGVACRAEANAFPPWFSGQLDAIANLVNFLASEETPEGAGLNLHHAIREVTP